MNKVKLGLRLFLGLVFFVFGLNGFLQFIPAQPIAEPAMAFAKAMVDTGYFFPMVKGLEVICGFLLLTNLFTPLALILLAPITVNIFLFHAFLAPQGMYIQVVILIAHLALAFTMKDTYRNVLKMKQ